METRFASGDALAAKLWSAKLFKESIKDIFFDKYTSEDGNNIIQKDVEFTKKKGNLIFCP